MAKPGDFYVGVLDFFAILLPGAIATAILSPRVGQYIWWSLIKAPEGDLEKWAAFLISAYFLGHLIFLLGAYIDGVYDVIRMKLNPYGNESAYQRAMQVRNEVLIEADQAALNTFQWARSVLITQFPAAAADIHRLEADSKFFRSLLVVCLVSAIAFLLGNRPVEFVCALLLVPLCFARYYERRLKSTTQAYIHIVTLWRLGCLKNEKA